MIEAIRDAWGWTGIKPDEVVDTNAFGNTIVRDKAGVYWRICPEDVSCEVIAKNGAAYEQLAATPDFRTDWEMTALVDAARDRFGPLSEGRCYCLKIPGVLGGQYAFENIGTIDLEELLRFSGSLGSQIKNMPDGTKVKFRFVQ